MDDGITIPKATLDFVMRPKTLPSPGQGQTLSAYLQECREEVEILLLDAVDRDALPNRTLLVQCVATNSELDSIDHTYDTVLRGSWDSAARACAGLCVINNYFSRNHGRSSHERARSFGNTKIGNIVVFRCGAKATTSRLNFQSNLIEIALDAPRWEPSERLLELIRDARSPKDGDPWRVSVQQILKSLDREQERSLVELPSGITAKVAYCEAFPFIDERDEPKKPNTKSLLDNIRSDNCYLNHVSALSSVGQIVLCMPQVFSYTNSGKPLGVFDLGITLVLSGEEAPTETELLQIFVVSRTIAGIHTSIHGAVRSLERRIGDQVVLAALGVLRHSAGNLLDKMASLSDKVAPHANMLKHVITGATTYACGESLPFFVKQKTSLTWKSLGHDGMPFERDIALAILAGNSTVSVNCEDIHDAVIDARLVPLVEELVRNLAKGPQKNEDGVEYKHSMKISKDSDCFCVNISICGVAKASQAREMIRQLKTAADSHGTFEHSLAVRGLGAIVSIVRAMRSDEGRLIYRFGKDRSFPSIPPRQEGVFSPEILGEEYAIKAKVPIGFSIEIIKLRAIVEA